MEQVGTGGRIRTDNLFLMRETHRQLCYPGKFIFLCVFITDDVVDCVEGHVGVLDDSWLGAVFGNQTQRGGSNV